MNGVPVNFHRLASREYRKARDWYEAQQPGLGAAFAAEVNRAAERIGESPERWPTFRKNYRFLLVDRFPYVLYYKILDSRTVLIVAVAHGRRRLGYWLGRTDEP